MSSLQSKSTQSKSTVSKNGKPPMPTWEKVLIGVGVLILLGGIGYGIYFLIKKQKENGGNGVKKCTKDGDCDPGYFCKGDAKICIAGSGTTCDGDDSKCTGENEICGSDGRCYNPNIPEPETDPQECPEQCSKVLTDMRVVQGFGECPAEYTKIIEDTQPKSGSGDDQMVCAKFEAYYPGIKGFNGVTGIHAEFLESCREKNFLVQTYTASGEHVGDSDLIAGHGGHREALCLNKATDSGMFGEVYGVVNPDTTTFTPCINYRTKDLLGGMGQFDDLRIEGTICKF